MIRKAVGRKAVAPLLVGLLLCCARLDAATVTLLWDSNSEVDLAGYLVEYGTSSGQYDRAVDVGNHTSFRVTDLEAGRVYYFAVVAYNFAGVQSLPSREVSTRVVAQPMALSALFATVQSPVAVGTTVTFVAAASGGSGSYQYKWLVKNGSNQTVGQDWSTNNTFFWAPATAGSGYQIIVWAREGASTADSADNPRAVGGVAFSVTASSGPPPAFRP